ncbi:MULTISPECIES: hypothetical protein [unclassified Sporosarcina]|uniref:hypothetical protein n=1 Tax=unclassified Sporosarcina TaxID=2647733 RepID=UPI000C170C90|nr:MULTISPECIES: hypothetical protein [unclassified Sporosarcina]PIC67625.1 hypothetical protein CSV78_06890 [Sporosarcina sp. P16a]PIC71214.1 hypothetical protein CSV77_04050 [Sporosarcina sp. P16b]PIC89329.1 hypothetical protein CSV71_10425 [Sporosarcina sp. P21c]PIC93076.1 hypothetical protein CSV70_07640 [Sporosarcina sp. P25]PID25472.1 hypothetical protein CSV60_05280 [Sporosarcina sp. P7]
MASQVFGMIILWIIGLFILYLVIYKAVKEGINKSVVGQSIERTTEPVVNKKSFTDDDLDN